MKRGRAALLVLLALAGCAREPAAPDADVIVVGAGIAGLAAALEASAGGASVIVAETSSVGGGHAVRAGGFALVGTPLQEKKGFADSPDFAYADMMAWHEDADPYWVRRYVDESRVGVYDWLAKLGVKFAFIIDTPEDSVPRFHFTRGAAVNAVVPMLRAALEDPLIRFEWNTEVTELVRSGNAITGVATRNTRSGAAGRLTASAVIVATGGFQSNLDLVRRTWREDRAAPKRLLIGSGEFATGSGIALGEQAGAGLYRMDRHVTFVNGLPDPRDPDRGLLIQNPRSIWVNAAGRRFVDESASSKQVEAALFAQSPQTHWLIFDAEGRRRLIVRGAVWLEPDSIREEILNNESLVSTAQTIEALAGRAGLPPDVLAGQVERFNRAAAQGTDPAFGRFDDPSEKPFEISAPPFYAMQLYPMTRKSMGGLAIDHEARVSDTAGEPIPGLYAAGEVTGVAGINGSHGGSGTFLGPSVLLGRIAGREAARAVADDGNSEPGSAAPVPTNDGAAAIDPALSPPTISTQALAGMVAANRPGYWHFESAHRIVLERQADCAECHSPAWPTGPAATTEQRILQLESCTRCH